MGKGKSMGVEWNGQGKRKGGEMEARGERHSSRIRFLRFFQNPKKNATLYVFLKCHSKKNANNVESVIQVFTLLTLKLLTDAFAVKHYTRHVLHATLYWNCSFLLLARYVPNVAKRSI